MGVALPKMDISLFFLIFFSTCFFLISWADQNFGCTKIDTHRLGDGGGGVLFGVFFFYLCNGKVVDGRVLEGDVHLVLVRADFNVVVVCLVAK